MKHRIVVLGAGYAGAFAAGNLARRLSPADTEITVVNAEPDFVQRLRLHQLAAGQEIEAPKLADVFAGTAIRLRLGRVTDVDPERRAVAVADAVGGGELGYDTLLYALGSHGADHGVPGMPEHAFDVAGRPSALRLRERLDSLGRRGEGGTVLVVGDGLTGIETATEIAESRPGLSVTLIARGELGARLSAGARSHLRQACDRFGITVLEHTSVEAVEASRVLCADGRVLASDATRVDGRVRGRPHRRRRRAGGHRGRADRRRSHHAVGLAPGRLRRRRQRLRHRRQRPAAADVLRFGRRHGPAGHGGDRGTPGRP
ncbi:UNVERIFIED_CONTAM: NADH dehydrogenase FAD-containing subunit [Streptomyces graminofaciens]